MIRLAVTQPNLRPYRVPVFNLLADQPEIELTVFAGRAGDAPEPDRSALRFTYEYAPMIERHLIGPLHYKSQPTQIDIVDPDRFDLLIMSWDAHYRTLPTALRKARRLGLPTVVWGHGYSKRESRLRTWMRNRVGRMADALLLYTRPIAERLVRVHGFPNDRVFVAQNAIDQTPIQRARRQCLARGDELAAFRRKHALDPAQTIAFVSRLYADNRADLLLRALPDLRNDLPDVKVVIVGDGPERQPLAQLADELGVADRVIFPGVIYDEQQLAPWLLSAAVFCYPENIGLSILTAFGFGLPVVTADNIESQNPEIAALDHERNGLLYRHGDVGVMTDALRAILTDPARREAMSSEAIRTVTEQFTLANMVQGFLDCTYLVDAVRRAVVTPDAETSSGD